MWVAAEPLGAPAPDGSQCMRRRRSVSQGQRQRRMQPASRTHMHMYGRWVSSRVSDGGCLAGSCAAWIALTVRKDRCRLVPLAFTYWIEDGEAKP